MYTHDRSHDGGSHNLLIEVAPEEVGLDTAFENAQNDLKELVTNRLSLRLIKNFPQPGVMYDGKDWAILLLDAQSHRYKGEQCSPRVILRFRNSNAELRERVIESVCQNSAEEILAIGEMAVKCADGKISARHDLPHLHVESALGENSQGSLENACPVGDCISTFDR